MNMKFFLGAAALMLILVVIRFSTCNNPGVDDSIPSSDSTKVDTVIMDTTLIGGVKDTL